MSERNSSNLEEALQIPKPLEKRDPFLPPNASPPPPTAGWEAQRSFHRNCGKGFLAPEGTSCELDAVFKGLKGRDRFASVC